MKQFKIGDKVFATKNPAWGRKPMIVVNVMSNYCSCRHQDFSSTGGFLMSEIEPFTQKRAKAVAEYNKKLSEARKIGKNLFGNSGYDFC